MSFCTLLPFWDHLPQLLFMHLLVLLFLFLWNCAVGKCILWRTWNLAGKDLLQGDVDEDHFHLVLKFFWNWSSARLHKRHLSSRYHCVLSFVSTYRPRRTRSTVRESLPCIPLINAIMSTIERNSNSAVTRYWQNISMEHGGDVYRRCIISMPQRAPVARMW